MTVMTKTQIEAERVLENRRAAFDKRVRNLLGHVGTRTSQKLIDVRFYALSDAERVEYGPAADKLAVELAQVEPVGRALMPQKVEAVKAAREDAQRVIERVLKDLEEKGWDLNAAAPYPDSLRTGRDEYKRMSSKRNLYSSLTEHAGSGYNYNYNRNGPELVKRSEEGVARFVSNTEQDAAIQYDMFICKMVGKVGDVVQATIEGDHVWSHSILTVTNLDRTETKWKTQQIVNYSVYGTPYLQWPSRVVK
jgi:hypothetical protein